VRVAGFTSGRMACTLPSKLRRARPGFCACTLAPGRSRAAWLRAPRRWPRRCPGR
jgi:hypothetical protein